MHAEFGVEVPASLGEALTMLAQVQSDGRQMLLAGGTNVLVDLRARNGAPDTLISIGRLSALRGIRETNGRVSVGGCTTVSDILRSRDMRRLGPSLVDAAKVFAGQMVRNTATIAGNICCGSPAADLVPPLVALDAVVTLENTQGKREVPLCEYFVAYKRSVRRSDEILTRVTWPTPEPNSRDMFFKLARRKGDAITVVGVAVSIAAEGGKCQRARVALGAVAPFVIRAARAEAMLEGRALTPELIEAAAQEASAASSPIDDIRASAEYRRQQVFVLTRRLVSQAWAALSEGNTQP